MSDEQRKDEEAEVEAHRLRASANDEPVAEGEDENDFEAHRSRFGHSKKD